MAKRAAELATAAKIPRYLIPALAQQLGGTVEWHAPPGTQLIIQFATKLAA